MIASRQTLSAEYRFFDADKPEGISASSEPRAHRLEYSVDHLGDEFLHPDQPRRPELPAREGARSDSARRRELAGSDRPTAPTCFLQGFELFRDFLGPRGAPRWTDPPPHPSLVGRAEHQVDFGEPAYLARDRREPRSSIRTTLRFVYTSLTTPMSSYDYDMKKRSKTLVKREEVLGGLRPGQLRHRAAARDRGRRGTKVPISIVYPQGIRRDGTPAPAPVRLRLVWGQHGRVVRVRERLSLLDRGFAYAIAHIRGGQELGRAWYEDGKLLKKKNTFTDFHRLCRVPGPRGVHQAAPPLRPGRAPAGSDGRRHQHAARPVQGGRSRPCRSWTSSPRCSIRRSP